MFVGVPEDWLSEAPLAVDWSSDVFIGVPGESVSAVGLAPVLVWPLVRAEPASEMFPPSPVEEAPCPGVLVRVPAEAVSPTSVDDGCSPTVLVEAGAGSVSAGVLVGVLRDPVLIGSADEDAPPEVLSGVLGDSTPVVKELPTPFVSDDGVENPVSTGVSEPLSEILEETPEVCVGGAGVSVVEESSLTVEPASEMTPSSVVGEVAPTVFPPGVIPPGVDSPSVVLIDTSSLLIAEMESEISPLPVAEGFSCPGVLCPIEAVSVGSSRLVNVELASVISPSRDVEEPSGPSVLCPVVPCPGVVSMSGLLTVDPASEIAPPLVGEEFCCPGVVCPGAVDPIGTSELVTVDPASEIAPPPVAEELCCPSVFCCSVLVSIDSFRVVVDVDPASDISPWLVEEELPCAGVLCPGALCSEVVSKDPPGLVTVDPASEILPPSEVIAPGVVCSERVSPGTVSTGSFVLVRVDPSLEVAPPPIEREIITIGVSPGADASDVDSARLSVAVMVVPSLGILPSVVEELESSPGSPGVVPVGFLMEVVSEGALGVGVELLSPVVSDEMAFVPVPTGGVSVELVLTVIVAPGVVSSGIVWIRVESRPVVAVSSTSVTVEPASDMAPPLSVDDVPPEGGVAMGVDSAVFGIVSIGVESSRVAVVSSPSVNEDPASEILPPSVVDELSATGGVAIVVVVSPAPPAPVPVEEEPGTSPPSVVNDVSSTEVVCVGGVTPGVAVSPEPPALVLEEAESGASPPSVVDDVSTTRVVCTEGVTPGVVSSVVESPVPPAPVSVDPASENAPPSVVDDADCAGGVCVGLLPLGAGDDEVSSVEVVSVADPLSTFDC